MLRRMADAPTVGGRQRLLDVLSELLAVARSGLRLYRDGVDEAPAALRDRLLEFGDESQRHVDLLEQAVRELGGDPGYVSPQARLVAGPGDGTRARIADPERGPYFRLEALLLYELRDALVGEVLDRLAAASEEPDVRDVLHRTVLTVRSGESLGAHDVTRHSERVRWLEHEMRTVLLAEFGLTPPSRRDRLFRGY
jgi:hypothetical protein